MVPRSSLDDWFDNGEAVDLPADMLAQVEAVVAKAKREAKKPQVIKHVLDPAPQKRGRKKIADPAEVERLKLYAQETGLFDISRSAAIRHLHEQGVEVAAIKEVLDLKHYQQAYNVVRKYEEQKRKENS